MDKILFLFFGLFVLIFSLIFIDLIKTNNSYDLEVEKFKMVVFLKDIVIVLDSQDKFEDYLFLNKFIEEVNEKTPYCLEIGYLKNCKQNDFVEINYYCAKLKKNINLKLYEKY